jgi:hypothetical protein
MATLKKYDFPVSLKNSTNSDLNIYLKDSSVISFESVLFLESECVCGMWGKGIGL